MDGAASWLGWSTAARDGEDEAAKRERLIEATRFLLPLVSHPQMTVHISSIIPDLQTDNRHPYTHPDPPRSILAHPTATLSHQRTPPPRRPLALITPGRRIHLPQHRILEVFLCLLGVGLRGIVVDAERLVDCRREKRST